MHSYLFTITNFTPTFDDTQPEMSASRPNSEGGGVHWREISGVSRVSWNPLNEPGNCLVLSMCLGLMHKHEKSLLPWWAQRFRPKFGVTKPLQDGMLAEVLLDASPDCGFNYTAQMTEIRRSSVSILGSFFLGTISDAWLWPWPGYRYSSDRINVTPRQRRHPEIIFVSFSNELLRAEAQCARRRSECSESLIIYSGLIEDIHYRIDLQGDIPGSGVSESPDVNSMPIPTSRSLIHRKSFDPKCNVGNTTLAKKFDTSAYRLSSKWI
jgi:hypothetical protein